MEENRCPMCSALNDETAEVCGECGARLSPLVLDEGGPTRGGTVPRESPPVEPAADDDWLARIRSGIGEYEEFRTRAKNRLSPDA